jgi:hypothetical protein
MKKTKTMGSVEGREEGGGEISAVLNMYWGNRVWREREGGGGGVLAGLSKMISLPFHHKNSNAKPISV